MFKSKILTKISYLLTLILYKSGDLTKVHIFKRIEEMF